MHSPTHGAISMYLAAQVYLLPKVLELEATQKYVYFSSKFLAGSQLCCVDVLPYVHGHVST